MIGSQDYQVKRKKIESLLKKAEQVKVVITFRGREIAHTYLAEQLMSSIIVGLSGVGQPVSQPKMMGNRLVTTFNPFKK